MRNISISIDQNGAVTVDGDNALLGYSGEHMAVKLSVVFSNLADSSFRDADYFRLVFDGYYSEDLYLLSGGLSYVVPSEAVTPPSVHCQLIGYKAADGEISMITKSAVFEFNAGYSELPYSKITGKTDVFERTLEKCRDYSEKAAGSAKTAQEAEDSAEKHADDAILAADSAAGYMEQSEKNCLDASGYAASAAASAAEAETSADRAAEYSEGMSELLKRSKNAVDILKKRVSGNIVYVDDLPEWEQEISVTCSPEDFVEQREIPVDTVYTFGDAHGFMTFSSQKSGQSVSFNMPLIQAADPETVTVDAEFDAGNSIIEYHLRLIKQSRQATGSYTIKPADLSGEGVTYPLQLDGLVLSPVGFPQTVSIPGEATGLRSYTATLERTEVLYSSRVNLCGRNLLPFAAPISTDVCGLHFSTEGGTLFVDGTYTCPDGSASPVLQVTHRFNLPSGTYYFSSFENVQAPENSRAVILNSQDVPVCTLDISGKGCVPVTLDGSTQYCLGFDFGSVSEEIDFDHAPIFLELGVKKADRYEPVRIQSQFADENGSVAGLKTSGTAMTVYSLEGEITVEYIADIWNSIPTKVGQLENDSGYVDEAEVKELINSAGPADGVRIEDDDGTAYCGKFCIKGGYPALEITKI